MAQTRGLDEFAGACQFVLRKPTALAAFTAARSHAGLRPDGEGVKGFGLVNNCWKFVQGAIGVNQVGAFGWTADASRHDLAVLDLVSRIVLRPLAAMHHYLEAGACQQFRDLLIRPINDQDRVDIPEHVFEIRRHISLLARFLIEADYVAGWIRKAGSNFGSVRADGLNDGSAAGDHGLYGCLNTIHHYVNQ